MKTLSDDEWSVVSVCDPWTVRQLVAHLTSMGNQTRWNFLTGLARNRFDFDAFLGRDMLHYDVGSDADILAAFERTGAPVRGKERVHDLSMRATDIEWSDGNGPDVAGPAFDLLMAIGGRSVALDNCEGPGVDILRSRCT